MVALEGVALVVVAAILVVRAIGGAHEKAISGYGTAVWYVVMGAAVFAAGWALWTGRRWGRGLAVFAQLLLLPVAWYIAVGSQQWAYGVPVALVAVGRAGSVCSARRHCSGRRRAPLRTRRGRTTRGLRPGR